jgi:hypothetical protein
MNQPSSCVFCRRNLPHERHVTPLEYAKLTSGMETYDNAYDNCVLSQSASNGMVTDQSGRKVA